MRQSVCLAIIGIALFLVGCGDYDNINPMRMGNDAALAPTTKSDYVVFAWNDLGMHCLNPTYDTAVILPPYNTLWAQVVKRGTRPLVVTKGIRVEYRMINT